VTGQRTRFSMNTPHTLIPQCVFDASSLKTNNRREFIRKLEIEQTRTSLNLIERIVYGIRFIEMESHYHHKQMIYKTIKRFIDLDKQLLMYI